MKSAAVHSLPSLEEAAAMSPQQIVDRLGTLTQTQGAMRQEIDALKHQLDWFRRQIFGQKSERRLFETDGRQLSLGEALTQAQDKAPPPSPEKPVAAHTRRAAPKSGEESAEALSFFDAARVPVEIVELPNPETEGLSPDQYEVVSRKETYRLAQRPGSYVVIKYVRPVIKRLDTQALSCPPAPAGVIEGSRADVSFVAGLLIDKFLYHLPLHRQHLRLVDAGFKSSRPWLTQLTRLAIALLEPIYEAQLASVRRSRVKAMDETPIKAGRAGPGKMKGGYFWPVYGELDEVVFPFCSSRAAHHVTAILGPAPPVGTTDPAPPVLLTDGYAAYERYVENSGLLHAQCWAHSRRKFFEAQAIEPEKAGEALDKIGALYAVETRIREAGLLGDEKRAYRQRHARPLVADFFAWVQQQFDRQGFLPSSPLTKALAYVRERQAGLSVFLDDPEVPVDTNHLERALRAIPMGRRNWLFCWTEVGAKQAGIIQSLLVTCRLQGLDPYDYLVDVLQRVGQHPADRVHELTPRLWKQLFAANPLRSDLYSIGK